VCQDICVPRHLCAKTSVCQDICVPRHLCAKTSVCQDICVTRHLCDKTSVCQDLSPCGTLAASSLVKRSMKPSPFSTVPSRRQVFSTLPFRLDLQVNCLIYKPFLYRCGVISVHVRRNITGHALMGPSKRALGEQTHRDYRGGGLRKSSWTGDA